MRNSWLGLSLGVLTSILSGCGKKSPEGETLTQDEVPYCANKTEFSRVAGTSGTGLVFDLNPQVSANDPSLLPTSPKIENLAAPVKLERLLGYGILNGEFVDVRNGLCEKSSIGAFSEENNFSYPHSDPRFPEVMSYYYGDQYRKVTQDAGVLLPEDPVIVLANCPIEDNAFFTRDLNDDGTFRNIVCLGGSSIFSSQKATFADDAHVVIHELQHAQSTYSYSPKLGINRLIYDEGGALNEAISDVVGLMNTYERNSSAFDVKRFSVWGLGSLFGTDGDFSRGAHRCPTYDPTYPRCTNYKSDSSGFSTETNTVSFNYPDGMGWPYAGFYSGARAVRNAFVENKSHQQIHQSSIVMTGALYEVFEIFVKSRSDVSTVREFMMKVISRSLQRLPKPNKVISVSPITFPGFFMEVVSAADFYGASSGELTEVKRIGEERGLYDAPQLGPNWANVIGMRFEEISGSAKYDGKLNPGDVGRVWFNIQNVDSLTAGGVLVDFKVPDGSAIEVISEEMNDGFVSDQQAMIRYGKVNGTAIVSALNSTDVSRSLPLKNDYFGTYTTQDGNAAYQDSGIFIKVKKGASPGPQSAQLRLVPANGPEVILPITIEVIAE
jgi:hypothetical protein